MAKNRETPPPSDQNPFPTNVPPPDFSQPAAPLLPQGNSSNYPPSLNADDIPEVDTETHEVKQVRIKGQIYTIKEMPTPIREKYLSNQANRASFDKKTGKMIPGSINLSGYQAELISLCLFDPMGTPVPYATVYDWPAKAQEQLYQMCEEMNCITPESKEAVKKA